MDKNVFEINGEIWELEEKSLEYLIEEYEKAEDEKPAYVLGLTTKHLHKVFINEDLCYAQKRKTLMHELMHVYLWEYGFSGRRYDEEDICDIFAGANKFINETLEKKYPKIDTEFSLEKGNVTYMRNSFDICECLEKREKK